MKFDVIEQIGAVVREVGGRERDGRPVWVLVATRTYDAAAADLWDALTNAERIPRWFLPVSGDLKLGGRYQLQGNASGVVTECEPPRHLALTWEMHGQVSWVDVRLSEVSADRTLLTLEHVAHVGPELWGQFGPGAVGVGWDLSLMGLGRHLASGAAADPAEKTAWLSSAEGKAFCRGCSEAWGEASIEFGTAPDAARAAAARTTAAYTGEAAAQAPEKS